MHNPWIDPALGRRQLFRMLLGAVAGLTLTGCRGPVPALRVGSIVFPTYEYAFVARELGWLDARQIRLVEYSDNTYVLRALAAGQLDAAQLTLDEAITARAAGIALTVVLVLDVSAGSDAAYALQPMTLAELAGKRVALEEGATGALLLDGMLRAAGVTVDQIQKVPSNLSLSVEVFERGDVDVVVTAEPWASKIEKAGGVRLFDSSQIPNRIIDVLAVRTEAIASRTAAIGELVTAIVKARSLHLTRSDDVVARMAPRLQLEVAQVADAFRGLNIPTLADNRNMLKPDGQIVLAAQALQDVMLNSGLLAQKLPSGALIDALVDARFLPDGDAT